MPVKRTCKSALGVALLSLCAYGATFLQATELYAQGQIKAVYRFPDLAIKQFQNGQLPGSVTWWQIPSRMA